MARLVERLHLSQDCTGRDIFFITLHSDGPWHYAAGDWLVIPPCNAECDVDQLLQLLHCSGSESCPGGHLLREILLRHRTISRVSPAIVDWLMRSQNVSVGRDVCNGHGVADFLKNHATTLPSWQELLPLMKPLAPRVYSIASGPAGGGGDIRLLVGTAIYHGWDGTMRCGVASSYLTARLQPGDFLHCRVVQSRFHLPDDSQTDLILVGPGVGLAPFLGFLEQRAWLQSMGHTLGRCWLFFGARNRATDFFAEKELGQHLASGILSRLDTAFSRDQLGKIYVQDKIRENGAELWRWLANGAYFYVCGDAMAMAKDVEKTIEELIATHGEMDSTAAKHYVFTLRSQGRYRRDVY
jgi:sulfite reductase alpha subunit-like flavoprotein